MYFPRTYRPRISYIAIHQTRRKKKKKYALCLPFLLAFLILYVSYSILFSKYNIYFSQLNALIWWLWFIWLFAFLEIRHCHFQKVFLGLACINDLSSTLHTHTLCTNNKTERIYLFCIFFLKIIFFLGKYEESWSWCCRWFNKLLKEQYRNRYFFFSSACFIFCNTKD